MTSPVPHEEGTRDPERVWALLQNARGAARRLTSILIANAHRLDVPFANDPRTPWDTHVSPAINNLRAALGMRGAWPIGCACDLHGRNCEPPSELCCDQCSEIQHPSHVDGSVCSAPDLSGTAMPARVEIDLRAEVSRLTTERDEARALAAEQRDLREAAANIHANAEFHLARLRPVVEAAEAWCDQFERKTSGFPRRDALIAAVDTYRRPPSEGKEST